MTVPEALQLLALPVNFTELDLKKAYRERMLIWHPDRFQANDPLKVKAAHQASLINEAKSVLDDHLTSSPDGLPQKLREHFYKPPKRTRAAAPHFTPHFNTHYTPKRRPSKNKKTGSRKSGPPPEKSWLQRNPRKAMTGGAALLSLLLFAGIAVGVAFAARTYVFRFLGG